MREGYALLTSPEVYGMAVDKIRAILDECNDRYRLDEIDGCDDCEHEADCQRIYDDFTVDAGIVVMPKFIARRRERS